MRFLAPLSLLLSGIVLGIVGMWFFMIPLVQAEREAFVLRQMWPCSNDMDEITDIRLPTQKAAIIVACDGNRDLSKQAASNTLF